MRFDTGKTALVVLNYNDSETTQEFVNRALNLSMVEYVVVVDNCSTDDSVPKLQSLESNSVRLVLAENNQGYAAGNNLGARYAIDTLGVSYLLIANPDTVLNDKGVKAIVDYLAEVSNVGVVTCKMVMKDTYHVPSAWPLPSFGSCLLEAVPGLDKLLPRKGIVDDRPASGPIKVGAAAGSFFGVRADSFDEVGGFDERTFLYYEENILGAKIARAGMQSYYLPYASYIHDHQVSICKSLLDKRRMFEIAQESRELYCREYLDCGPISLGLLRGVFRVGLALYLVCLTMRDAIIRSCS